jgi:hypothetical protein
MKVPCIAYKKGQGTFWGRPGHAECTGRSRRIALEWVKLWVFPAFVQFAVIYMRFLIYFALIFSPKQLL